MVIFLTLVLFYTPAISAEGGYAGNALREVRIKQDVNCLQRLDDGLLKDSAKAQPHFLQHLYSFILIIKSRYYKGNWKIKSFSGRQVYSKKKTLVFFRTTCKSVLHLHFVWFCNLQVPTCLPQNPWHVHLKVGIQKER